jgi:CheW-like domain
MGQLRNVVVFELGEVGEVAGAEQAGPTGPGRLARSSSPVMSASAAAAARRPLAADLRWVREITTLGFVTFLPSAPLPICGVVNAHGAITPVIDLAELLQLPSAGLPRQGDPALIVEVEQVVAAFRVDAIRHVATLPQPMATIERVLDRDDISIPLIDLPALLRRCAQLVGAAARAGGVTGVP